MKKSVWIFLFAVLLPSVVLGWLALRSAEEQQIVFERRTAELYQKETEALAVTVRDTVDAERRVFGETVHRLLAKGDPEALARDFTNTLTDAWQMKAVGFAINQEGKLVTPSVAAASKKPELQRFLLGNGGFLTSTEPAIVYNWAGDNTAYRNPKLEQIRGKSGTAQNASNNSSGEGGIASSPASMGKDTAPPSDSSVEESEAATRNNVLGTANVNWPFANAPMIVGNQSVIASVDSLNTQGTVVAPPLSSLTNTTTLALSGGVQLNCQVPANVSTFDFTSVMSTPDQRNLGNFLQQSGATAGDTSLNRAAQSFSASRKLQDGTLIANISEQTPLRPASPGTIAPAGAAASEADMQGIKLDATRSELPARSVADSSKKMSPAAQRADNDAPRAAHGESATLTQDASALPPMAKVRPDYSQAPASPAPIPAGPAKAVTIPSEQVPMPMQAPAAMPAESNIFAKSKTPSKKFPEAKSSNSAPAPGLPTNASKSASFKIASKNSDDAPTAMTKTGVGNLILNNAISRQVEPQQVLGVQGPALSNFMPEEAEFRSLTEEGDDGLVARFVQDKLNLIFWVRPPEAPEMVFGCLVEAGHFSELWKDVLERHNAAARSTSASLESKPEFVLALLDDRGKPVATQPADAPGRDWKRPFVASEIGEALPHWEAALYLASPTALAESARGLWRTLAFTIAGMVTLIALGGWLVVADARRQLALAQQKTDFVSNVSHELKTPLTSIRMFAELMHDRPQPPEKQGQYLRIITVEAERLTRLINNVLDFAKIGRKQKRIEKKPLDLHEVVARVWESQELHLREDGFTTRWEAAPGPYRVLGDDDALAQVLVNLLSNAEKYSNGNKDVELHTWLDNGWVNVSVLDCGTGVPSGDEKKIFEAFYRAHDSLNSGIQGSGLGLTLAQRIAREHGGEIKLEHREGGGSRFTLRLPLAGKVES